MREKTEKSYIKSLERYSGMDKRNAREVYEIIRGEGKSLGYIKNIMCAFKWKTKNEEYGKIIGELREEIDKGEKNVNKFKKIEWSKIEPPKGQTVDDLIKGLYTMFPPRRVMDYAYMIYQKKEGYEDKRYNYFVEETGEFKFCNYKTVGKYGIQRFKVPKDLNELIKDYIKKNEIKDGDGLIKYRKGSKKFSEQSLMKKIKKIFGTSVDGIRHAYISSIYSDRKKLLEIEEISEKMGHNVKTHLRYMDKENIK